MNTAEEVVLRPSKWSAIGMIAIGGVLVAGGILVMNKDKFWIGLFAVVFFGLCALVGLLQLLPGFSYLKLSAYDFTIHMGRRKIVTPWAIVEKFMVVHINAAGYGGGTYVGYNFTPEYKRGKVGRKFSRSLAGCEGMLPDNYGMKPQELADLMNRCLMKFTAESGDSPA